MPKFGLTTGLPQLPVTSDDKQFKSLQPVYSAINALAEKVSTGIGAVEFSQAELAERNPLASLLTQNHGKIYPFAPIAVAYGKLVNLYLDSGKLAVRLADCTGTTKPAHGIVTAPFGIDAGQHGEVLLVQGYTQGIAGSAIGIYYWLGTTGNANPVPPGAGNIRQGVGFGLGTAGFYLNISSYITT